ncbi:MAG: hydrogenase formation protein HypD [Gaiellaceae bacterium]|jgi:hydrogenase expression/formation protein HypD
MRYVDEFRSGELARALTKQLVEAIPPGRELAIMEVCGGHTHAIYKHGIDELLPAGLELVHGPGCPVCVIPVGRVDDAVALALEPDVIFATFGDMMRVPGSKGSLLDARSRGADVRMVYSPLDALALAQANPGREVIFFAIGFETTAPSTAVTLLQAQALGIENFTVFCNHVTIGPPLKAILDAPELKLDGLIAPGHVSAVIGSHPYDFIASEYGRPVVVAGFEPLDILQSILMLVRQLAAGRAEVENQYTRVVRANGNPRAQEAIEQTMELRDSFEWRGLGSIPHSGLRLREELADWDAERRHRVPGISVPDHKACQCGQVLRGLVKPWECKVFGTACTPEHPIGTCMVSSEGACAAYYHYGRNRPKRGTVPA